MKAPMTMSRTSDVVNSVAQKRDSASSVYTTAAAALAPAARYVSAARQMYMGEHAQMTAPEPRVSTQLVRLAVLGTPAAACHEQKTANTDSRYAALYCTSRASVGGEVSMPDHTDCA